MRAAGIQRDPDFHYRLGTDLLIEGVRAMASRRRQLAAGRTGLGQVGQVVQ